MNRSDTVRESRGIFVSFSARLRSSDRWACGSSSGLTCSELCGGTSLAMSDQKTRRSIDDVIHRRFLHRPFAGIAIVARQREAMPILVVELGMICAIIIAGPARFRAE